MYVRMVEAENRHNCTRVHRVAVIRNWKPWSLEAWQWTSQSPVPPLSCKHSQTSGWGVQRVTQTSGWVGGRGRERECCWHMVVGAYCVCVCVCLVREAQFRCGLREALLEDCSLRETGRNVWTGGASSGPYLLSSQQRIHSFIYLYHLVSFWQHTPTHAVQGCLLFLWCGIKGFFDLLSSTILVFTSGESPVARWQ